MPKVVPSFVLLVLVGGLLGWAELKIAKRILDRHDASVVLVLDLAVSLALASIYAMYKTGRTVGRLMTEAGRIFSQSGGQLLLFAIGGLVLSEISMQLLKKHDSASVSLSEMVGGLIVGGTIYALSSDS